MAAKQIVDFEDIIAAVREEMKYQSSDTISEDRIKRDINAVYLQEVVPQKRWRWLLNKTAVTHKAYYATGTATVTNGNATVTLGTAPSVGSGSRAGYLFKVVGFDEIYTISAHTAGATTVTLANLFNGTTSSTATFKIWTDTVALPTTCRETIEVWHDYYKPPMEGIGLQEYRRRVLETKESELKPKYYTPYDYKDPTPLTDETEADRFRVIKIHPSLTQSDITLNVDYIEEVDGLDADGDEPLMPVEDRIILVYGALARAWTRERNPNESARNRSEFNNILARMSSKLEDGFDKPQLIPDPTYISRKRGRNRTRSVRR